MFLRLRKKEDAKTAAAKVAAMFLRSVEKRLSADKVVSSHAHFFGKCTTPAIASYTPV